MDNAICVWDFTISCEKSNENKIREILTTHCKKWCFQKEVGEESGFEHFQGRCSLKVKKRLNGVIKLFGDTKAHLSPTSSENSDNMFYVTKEETRVAGPWSDKDSNLYIQKRFRGKISWMNWQSDILKKISVEPDDRTINVVIDYEGNKGKSYLGMYCLSHGLAQLVPPLNDYKEIIQSVMDMPTSNTYFIDYPRGLDKKNLNNFFSAMEQIKNGWLYDTRYSFKQKVIEPPHIWVFTNVAIQEELLSRDRWRCWYITPDGLGGSL